MPKGSFRIDLSDVHKKFAKFKKTLDDPSGVFSKTMADMSKRAPGKVADAVRTQYSIKKAELLPTKTKMDLKRAAYIKLTGQTIATFQLEYKGRMLTPLHFGMQPQTPSPLDESKSHVANTPNYDYRIYNPHKKYKISQKVKKKREKLSSPDDKGLVPFLAPAHKGSSRIIPFQRQANQRDIEKVFKGISVPEMIGPNDSGKGGNPEVQKIINEELGELLEKRFNHHMDRLLDKAVN